MGPTGSPQEGLSHMTLGVTVSTSLDRSASMCLFTSHVVLRRHQAQR